MTAAWGNPRTPKTTPPAGLPAADPMQRAPGRRGLDLRRIAGWAYLLGAVPCLAVAFVLLLMRGG